MDRLHRKCFIASAGLHLLLVLILVIGPAFRSPSRKGGQAAQLSGQPDPAAFHLITLLPDPLPESQPQPGRVLQPVPANPQPQPSLRSQKGTTGKGLKAPQANTNPASRNSTPSARSNPSRDARVEQFGEIVKDIRQGHSSATTIESGGSTTDGDDVYAQFVKDLYTASWETLDADAKNDAAITKVTVTIGNDGKVLSASIIGPSGDTQVDKTVQRTLDRVRFIRPFGEGAKDRQRNYTINFSLNSKRT
jgi:TonB family protein